MLRIDWRKRYDDGYYSFASFGEEPKNLRMEALGLNNSCYDMLISAKNDDSSDKETPRMAASSAGAEEAKPQPDQRTLMYLPRQTVMFNDSWQDTSPLSVRYTVHPDSSAEVLAEGDVQFTYGGACAAIPLPAVVRDAAGDTAKVTFKLFKGNIPTCEAQKIVVSLPSSQDPILLVNDITNPRLPDLELVPDCQMSQVALSLLCHTHTKDAPSVSSSDAPLEVEITAAFNDSYFAPHLFNSQWGGVSVDPTPVLRIEMPATDLVAGSSKLPPVELIAGQSYVVSVRTKEVKTDETYVYRAGVTSSLLPDEASPVNRYGFTSFTAPEPTATSPFSVVIDLD